MAIVGILAIGQTFVILTAGIDLSVGSILGLCVVLFADLLQTQSLAVAIPVGILCGGLMGIFNGLGIAYARIPAFIMTLGMLYILARHRIHLYKRNANPDHRRDLLLCRKRLSCWNTYPVDYLAFDFVRRRFCLALDAFWPVCLCHRLK